MDTRTVRLAGTAAFVALGLCATAALAQAGEDAAVRTQSLWDLVKAGGPVGHTIIGLSVVGVALVIDAFLRTRPSMIIPPALVEQILELAPKGRIDEILTICKANESLLGRIVAAALVEGRMGGIDAVREALQQHGSREITRLRHRTGYLGVIAAVAPMLGLLGTVTGMIISFQLLGEAKGAARPDELAFGISQALITTCEGLIVAVPLTFAYVFFRDRITRAAQDLAAVGEKLLRIMTVVARTRQGAKP